jgi:8-oxo-dGTP pyrophosphatase MutT (NUDIX family)
VLTRPFPYRPDRPIEAELAGGGIVRRPGGREILLLHQRADDRWCLPKGHVEKGESLAEATLREVGEETGLQGLRLGPEVAEVHYRFFAPAKGRNTLKIVVYFEVESADERVVLESGFDDHRWARPAEARRLLPFAEDHLVLDALRLRTAGPRRPVGRPTGRQPTRRSKHPVREMVAVHGKGFSRRA